MNQVKKQIRAKMGGLYIGLLGYLNQYPELSILPASILPEPVDPPNTPAQ